MNQRKSGIVLSYINILLKNMSAFLYAPFLIRVLGQSDYGLYQMTTSFMTTIFVLHLGISSSYIKFYSEKYNDNKKLEQLNGMYLLIFLGLTVLSVVLGYILTENIDIIFSNSFTAKELITTKKLMQLLIINVSLTFPSVLFDCYILAKEQFKIQRMHEVLITLFVPLGTIPFLLMKCSVTLIIAVQVIVTFLFLLLKCKVACVDLKMRFGVKGLKKEQFKLLFSFSFFIFINQLVDIINWNFPNFVLGIFSGSKEVSLYGVANQVKNVFLTLSTAIGSVYIPQVYKLGKQNRKQLSLLMCKVGKMQLLIISYLFGGFIVLGQYFIQLWVGNAYHKSYILAVLLIIPLIIPSIQILGMEIVRMFEKHRVVSVIYLLFSFFNMLISFSLTPNYLSIGAAIGTLTTMFLANGLIMNFYYYKVIKLEMKFFWSEMSKLFIVMFSSVFIIMLMKTRITIDSFGIFLIFGVIYTFLYGVFFTLIALNKNNRIKIILWMKNYFKF
ncbi:lipopolysaccharide biosynthesis protein [Enterococcus lactis]|uniref:lipopolysaccharide biosynthesis protein n=1 Tax=Enterococcus lactis TaxID=357441 RepID=UPI004041D317